MITQQVTCTLGMRQRLLWVVDTRHAWSFC